MHLIPGISLLLWILLEVPPLKGFPLEVISINNGVLYVEVWPTTLPTIHDY